MYESITRINVNNNVLPVSDYNTTTTDYRRAYGELIVAIVVHFKLVCAFAWCVDLKKNASK